MKTKNELIEQRVELSRLIEKEDNPVTLKALMAEYNNLLDQILAIKEQSQIERELAYLAMEKEDVLADVQTLKGYLPVWKNMLKCDTFQEQLDEVLENAIRAATDIDLAIANVIGQIRLTDEA